MTEATSTINTTDTKVSKPRKARVTKIAPQIGGRPNRADFYKMIVVNSDGQVVQEKEWVTALGDATGRALGKALRSKGWGINRVFNQSGYTKAKEDFSSQTKTGRAAARISLIDSAFEKSGVAREAHLERAANAVAPLLRDVPEGRAINAIRNMIQVVSRALPGQVSAAQ